MATMYFCIKIWPGAAGKALSIYKFDLSAGDHREGRLHRDSVSGRQTSDHDRE